MVREGCMGCDERVGGAIRGGLRPGSGRERAENAERAIRCGPAVARPKVGSAVSDPSYASSTECGASDTVVSGWGTR